MVVLLWRDTHRNHCREGVGAIAGSRCGGKEGEEGEGEREGGVGNGTSVLITCSLVKSALTYLSHFCSLTSSAVLRLLASAAWPLPAASEE